MTRFWLTQRIARSVCQLSLFYAIIIINIVTIVIAVVPLQGSEVVWSAGLFYCLSASISPKLHLRSLPIGVCVFSMSVVPSFPGGVAIWYAVIVIYLWFYGWRHNFTCTIRGTSIDIVAASDVIASSCAGWRPCCVVLVASCPRRRRAPRLCRERVAGRRGRRLQCTIALLALPAEYAEQGLCNCRASFRPAIRLSRRLSAANAGSVMLRADGGDSTQTCSLINLLIENGINVTPYAHCKTCLCRWRLLHLLF